MTPNGDVVDFNAFLARQNKCELSRRERTDRVRNQETHSYAPRLCRRSVQIVESGGDLGLEDFFNRQNMHKKKVFSKFTTPALECWSLTISHDALWGSP